MTTATDRIADQLIELLPPAVSHRLSEPDLDAIATAVHTLMQPPTREQIAEAANVAIGEWWGNGGNLGLLRPTVVDAVLALFPQPGPSAEGRVCQWCDGTARGDALDAGGDDVHNSCGSDGHGFEFVVWTPAEPVSIADMAPGTEFLCEGKRAPGVEHHMRVMESFYRDGTRILWCLTHEFGAAAPYVDPSTIRAVTPPPATPERD